MRTKGEILSRVLANADKASSEEEIALIHGLAHLEVMLDIRDILRDLAKALLDKKEIRL